MNIYDGVLSFDGTWRTYQKRVLDRAERYLDDGKVHIVAAPGSGKTTLGIELIRRLGQPCLILSPSITIRQQWIARMTEGFLVEGNSPEEWFSNDIRSPKPITAITYQALHSCMRQYVGVLEEEEGESESVDYSGFDIYRAIQNSGIRTVCLDEAHHLRSEWWKALEDFLGQIPQVTIISLTATPPYDSTPAQWKRYIDLCGPIDEEIFTPELVKEGSLCPHQDYVYFNWPTAEEKAVVQEYVSQRNEVAESLKQDPEFARMVAAHRGILAPTEYSEKFLDEPKYFSSILIFLHEMGIPFSPYLKELTGTKGKLPRLTNEWLEVLLQGFLYDDTESYPCDKVYREALITRLKAAGCIHRNKVELSQNKSIEKLLVASRGKLDSIHQIVRAEHESLGDDLRLLVLCDYIKKEMVSSVGAPERPVSEIGAVPIFEQIRREQIPGIRLGVLSGSVIIVPSDVKKELDELLRIHDCEGTMDALRDTGYSKVTIRGNNHHIVTVITEIFTRGRINTLIGTKSLLGEGWDSPCINSLILATYVGSFMLSNQMRGRAIRVFRGNPDKTSNIWHLACVFPDRELAGKIADDYDTLNRRFEAFLGVSATEDVVESGLARLGITERPKSEREIRKNNEQMLRRAADREGLRRSWDRSLRVIYNKMSMEEVQEVPKEALEPGYLFLNAVTLEIISAIAMILMLILNVAHAAAAGGSVVGFVLAVLLFVTLCLVVRYGYRIVSLCTPQKRMKKVADGILKALIAIGKIEEPQHCHAVVEEEEILVGAYLKGGTTRDKTLFAACMAQFWGVIDNPRYLLLPRKGLRRFDGCYAVPDAFGKRREDADVFASCMKKALGACDAVYTRTPEGRRILLKARTHSFVNKNERCLTGKKQVKSEFE